jgi:hypothetical protein
MPRGNRLAPGGHKNCAETTSRATDSSRFRGTHRPLRDSEKHPHRHLDPVRRGEDIENPSPPTTRDRCHPRLRESEIWSESAHSRAISMGSRTRMQSWRYRAFIVINRGRFPEYKSAANLSRIAALPRRCRSAGIALRRNGPVAHAASSRECAVSFNPPIARIDVETLTAQEPY